MTCGNGKCDEDDSDYVIEIMMLITASLRFLPCKL